MVFTSEKEFEEAVIKTLFEKGWSREVIKYPTEQDLIENWKKILFDNNRELDRLNDYPLTDTEMDQIMCQIRELRTPMKLNSFINGKTISIKRDNPDDKAHLGKEISLKIYDRDEICAGDSRYQIVQQPKFKRLPGDILPERRGDLMLLINGMPVFHIELKRSGIPVSQATTQIEKYAKENIFTGLFSLVQIFVAMNPEETVYFANPGPNGKFNSQYFFHWADFYNEPINKWLDICEYLLSIPMAHKMLGFYTIADETDGILKVMRSYQYYAANKISDVVSKTDWSCHNQHGGHIWHTTGSGKTMTSFKSAQLIANSKDADKVVFLTDRIELGTQSFNAYRNFANDRETVQSTENTDSLVARLKSDKPGDTLIVTSIQKMSNISLEDEYFNAADIKKIRKKRIVFIIDEAHRSTFGEMIITIKQTFPQALLFGFTGTPIHEENKKHNNTTTSIFGSELHRYSIADGIRDKNVLGFDIYAMPTFKDSDIRKVVALHKLKVSSEEEIYEDEELVTKYNKYLSMDMAGHLDENKNWIKGVEDSLPTTQYHTDEHRSQVVKDIKDTWKRMAMYNSSKGYSKFHAIFATSSINEAITYYRLIKQEIPEMKVTCLFDPSIDNSAGFAYKEDGLIEIVTDYNERYNQTFTLESTSMTRFKKDVASRMSHKDQYKHIEEDGKKQLDLMIVVDQMLTGFDSKYVNTLYLDKKMKYENIIQAFSRTNRLCGPQKPFGIIRWYRYPHTMKQYVKEAIALYSGDKPKSLFVDKLPTNIEMINQKYEELLTLFKSAGITDYSKLPEDQSERAKFALSFKQFNEYLEAARVQGFTWDKHEYEFVEPETDETYVLETKPEQEVYNAFLQRYKELAEEIIPDDPDQTEYDRPYEIEGYLMEIDTGKIDNDYMNRCFNKYLESLSGGVSEEVRIETLNQLHKSYAVLSQEEQKYADIFLHDVQRGEVKLDESKTFRDYIMEYMSNARNDQIHAFASIFDLDEELLRGMMQLGLDEKTINDYGRFDTLVESVDRTKAKQYFEQMEKKPVPIFKVNIKIDKFLRKFILEDGFNVDAK